MNRTTSIYLDVVRPMAALIVLLSHVSYQGLSGGQAAFLSGAGIQAVDVFFVLSGFVIAHVRATREHDARIYFISRAARIYSVAIPALIVTAIADTIGLSIDAATYSGPYQALSPGLLTRCLSFTGEHWNAHRFPGSNGPYWSLGFEVWYYVVFGVFLFSPRRWRWGAALGVLIFIGPKVTLMLTTWLMGVGAYYVCKSQRLSSVTGWIFLTVPLVVLAGYQLIPHSQLQPFTNISLQQERLISTFQDYLLAALFSIHLVGFSAVSTNFAPLLEQHAQSIRWIAGATFSIYLVHLPIMHLLAAIFPWPKSSPWMLLLLVSGTLVLCLVFAELTERRKDAWRRQIVSILSFIEERVPRKRARLFG
jgi:peptidoglycan/LPS O-acetylase OafA/YrhL